MIVYKLTDKDGYTRRGEPGETLWSPGVIRKTSGRGALCTAKWTHAYEHPILAVLHDSAHGRYGDPGRLWECDTMDGVVKRDGMRKLGTSKLKILREIEKPKVTSAQRVAYAISVSLRVYIEEDYVWWAEDWLADRDRSKKSASEPWSRVVGTTVPIVAKWATDTAESFADGFMDLVEFYSALCALSENCDLLDCAREVFLME